MSAPLPLPVRAAAILEYWFGPGYADAGDDFCPQDKMRLWFGGGPDVDQYIRSEFGPDLERMGQGELDGWGDGSSPLSLLAGVVLIDQFSRNIHRGKPDAFALDPKALSWATHALESGAADRVAPIMRTFFYLPFMHAEDVAAQERCVELYRTLAGQTTAHAGVHKYVAGCVPFAEAHRDIVAKWGRFPHRNAVLGRQSTPGEAAGLADGSIKGF